jgi:hypothetical protein
VCTPPGGEVQKGKTFENPDVKIPEKKKKFENDWKEIQTYENSFSRKEKRERF